MRGLSLSDLALALLHLLDEKVEVLDSTLCGQLFRPRLAAQLAAVEALPPVGLTGRPLAEALEEAELVGTTTELLDALRVAIGEELAADPIALDQIDAELFGFIDLLASQREVGMRRWAMAINVAVPGLADLAPFAE